MRATAALPLVVALVLFGPVPARAWGFDVHRLLMDRAIDLLPDAIRPFFQKHRAFIVERSVDPDLWRTAGWTDEPPRHFVDLDAYGQPPFAGLPRDYDRAVEQYGADFVQRNGTLPWRVSEIYGQLTRNFELQKKGTPGYSLENIKFFSAILGHYVSDGHVPFHAVLNYDGQLTGQRGIHSRWETDLVLFNRDALRIAPPPLTRIDDPRAYMFEVLQASFPLAAVILKADKAAAAGREAYDDEYYGNLFAETRPILEQRLSAAASGIASIIVSAWEAGGRPDLPLEPKRELRKVPRRRQ